MATRFFTRDDFRRIKEIKKIALWFLFLQSLLIIGWAFAVKYYLEFIFTADGWIKGYAYSLGYFIPFYILTLNIVVRKPTSVSINLTKIKLTIISIFVIIPVSILIAFYFLFVH